MEVEGGLLAAAAAFQQEVALLPWTAPVEAEVGQGSATYAW